MAHFKRGRPKQSRAGCLMCKPHKANWMKDSAKARAPQEQRIIDSLDSSQADFDEFGHEGYDD